MENKWANLPTPILTNIFRYLGLDDRKNASLCCRSWSGILNSPSLWRFLICQFHSELQISIANCCNGFKCLRILNHCSPWIQNLTILITHLQIDENVESMITFFQRLIEAEDVPQLKIFVIVIQDLVSLNFNEELMHELSFYLSKFLRRQKCLFSFRCFLNLPPIDAALVVDAVAFGSAKTLKVLYICKSEANIWRVPDIFCTSLNSFITLNYLKIPYEILNDCFLLSVAKNCHFLRLLIIYLNVISTTIGTTMPMISDDLWMKVSNILPKLGVLFDFGFLMDISSIFMKMIPVTVPLAGLRCIHVSLKPWMISYLSNFTERIKCLEIICSTNESQITTLITSCLNLTVLKLVDVSSKEFIDDFFDLIIKGNIGLRHLSLLFQELTTADREATEQKCKHLWKSHQCFAEVHLKSYGDDYFRALFDDFSTKIYPEIFSNY